MPTSVTVFGCRDSLYRRTPRQSLASLPILGLIKVHENLSLSEMKDMFVLVVEDLRIPLTRPFESA